MDDSKYLVDEIRQVIESTVHPCYHNTAYTELYCRCPECGDSKKSKSSAHFYIHLKPPFKFYCQKCGYSGRLNQEVLNKLQIYNNDVVLNIAEANKTVSENTTVYVKKKQVEYNYKDELNEVTAKSLEYFNNRFGVNETLETLNSKFKCVCDPSAYLKTIPVDVSKSKFIFSSAIGFVSSDNKYIICRDITGEQKVRYSNTPLTNDIDKSKIYNIRTPINMLEDEITLVITEGIFDCIGVYYKFYQNAKNVIIAAACGKSFIQVINKFIRMGFLNLKIKIYADTDVPVAFFKDMKRSSDFIKNNNIEIYYNKLGKDCGVRADQIDVQMTVI